MIARLEPNKDFTLPPFTYTYFVDLNRYATLEPSFLEVGISPLGESGNGEDDPLPRMSVSLGFYLKTSTHLSELVAEAGKLANPNVITSVFGISVKGAEEKVERALNKIVRRYVQGNPEGTLEPGAIKFVFQMEKKLEEEEKKRFLQIYEKLELPKVLKISSKTGFSLLKNPSQDKLKNLLLFFLLLRERVSLDGRVEISDPFTLFRGSALGSCAYTDVGRTPIGETRLFEEGSTGEYTVNVHLRVILPSTKLSLPWIEKWSQDMVKNRLESLEELSAEVKDEEETGVQKLFLKWSGPPQGEGLPFDNLIFYFEHEYRLPRIPLAMDLCLSPEGKAVQFVSFVNQESTIEGRELRVVDVERKNTPERRIMGSITDIQPNHDFERLLSRFEKQIPRLEKNGSSDPSDLLYKVSLFITYGMVQRAKALSKRLDSLRLCVFRDKPHWSLLNYAWGEKISRLLEREEDEVKYLTVWNLITPSFLKLERPDQMLFFSPWGASEYKGWKNFLKFVQTYPQFLESVKKYVQVVSELSFRALASEAEALPTLPYIKPTAGFFRVSSRPKKKVVLFEKNYFIYDYSEEMYVRVFPEKKRFSNVC